MEITIKDKNYPELLKKIKNPPEKLYVEGSFPQVFNRVDYDLI